MLQKRKLKSQGLMHRSAGGSAIIVPGGPKLTEAATLEHLAVVGKVDKSLLALKCFFPKARTSLPPSAEGSQGPPNFKAVGVQFCRVASRRRAGTTGSPALKSPTPALPSSPRHPAWLAGAWATAAGASLSTVRFREGQPPQASAAAT